MKPIYKVLLLAFPLKPTVFPSVAPAQTAEKAPLRTLRPTTEPMPAKPWHNSFIDENQKTPEGQINAGADALNLFIGKALENKLQTTSVRAKWENFKGFLDWAVWGYLSADSKYQGDERLVSMMSTWMDTLFVTLNTKPEDPKQAATWTPDTLGTWKFEIFALPMIEIAARPALAEKIGRERVERFRAIVLKNTEASLAPEAVDTILGRVDNMINFATHPFGLQLGGWMLTGDKRYWQFMENIVAGLDNKLLPDGMFSYQSDVNDPAYRETEMPYYHVTNVAALYMYWWATGSKRAEDILRRSLPYYPMNFEPPAIYNGGADIWWKDQWRPFWPMGPAMVAAATGDGENATIANEMARRKIEFDAYYLTLGALAYQQMGLKNVKEAPRRDNYIVESPDIRGVRTRFGNWSSTFTTGAFTFTRASAILSDPAKKGYWLNALHLARPYSRVAAMNTAPNIEEDYGTLDRNGTKYSLAKTADTAVFASSYRQGLTPESWGAVESLSKWRNHELWITTPQGMVGLIDSDLTAPTRAYEFSHQYRFIIPGDKDAVQVEPNRYLAGKLRFRIWGTDFPHAIAERVRRYNQGPKDRRDWQLSLSDTDRSPEQVIQQPKDDAEKASAVSPTEKYYAPGAHHYSLVEVSPEASGGFARAALASQGALLAIRTQKGGKQLLAIYNSGAQTATYRLPAGFKLEAQSWKTVKGGAPSTLDVPAQGVALFTSAGAQWDAEAAPAASTQAATEAKLQGVAVADIKPLRRAATYDARAKRSLQYLHGSFTLFNPQASYTVNYLADNDWEYHDWNDKRRIAAPYLPGLGFTKPNNNSWYYNGYIVIALDDLKAKEYAISKMEKVAAPAGAARVDVTWDTPKADLTLAFALSAERRGVLQQLTVRAKEPIQKIAVAFSAKPAGYGKDKAFAATDPTEKEWVVLGREREPADDNNIGCPSALLILPAEWDDSKSIAVGARLAPLVKTVALQPGDEAKMHWALWTFPTFSNAQATQYMTENAAATRAQIKKLFP
jgi:hypothetical protein